MADDPSTRFSDARAEGGDVLFEASRGGRAWRFRVTADALAMAQQGVGDGPPETDPLAAFERARAWLHGLAGTFVDEGHPDDREIVMDAAYMATASDR